MQGMEDPKVEHLQVLKGVSDHGIMVFRVPYRKCKAFCPINRQLFSGESEFQRIDVFESEEFGRFVALDGEIVFSDKDEFIYDEMVTHVPMTVHPNVKMF